MNKVADMHSMFQVVNTGLFNYNVKHVVRTNVIKKLLASVSIDSPADML